jgi:hypothetical protein
VRPTIGLTILTTDFGVLNEHHIWGLVYAAMLVPREAEPRAHATKFSDLKVCIFKSP